MSIQRDADKQAKERAAKAIENLIGRFEVATLTPEFTVYLDGSSTATEGEFVVGLTYIVGTTGTYVLKQGQLPMCLPTKRGAYP